MHVARSIARISLAPMLAALSLSAAAQTTWYVDVNATPPGSGTQADPYTEIQYAIDQSATLEGDTLLVAPGTYPERISITKDVAVKSSGGPLATVITSSGPGSVVFLSGTDNPWDKVFDGFTVTHTGSGAPRLVKVFDGTVRNCILAGDGGTTGITIDFLGSVQRTLVTGNSTGVSVGGFAWLDMRECIVWGNASDLEGGGAANIEYSAGFNTGFGFGSGMGNVGGDPDLWDLANADFHLRPGSPCIDAGDPASPLDPDGSPRDIGPLPHDASYAPPPVAYCTAKTNSMGCVPSIGAVGSASASGAPFVITCTNELSHRSGLFFYGMAPKAAAYQGGYLCVESPVRRTPVQDSGGTPGVDDCSGVYAFDFDAWLQSGADPALAAGRMAYGQFWSRDAAASFTTNRSDAIRFGIAP